MAKVDKSQLSGEKKKAPISSTEILSASQILVNLLLREWILTREFLAEMALANFNDFSETFLCIATFLNTTAQF